MSASPGLLTSTWTGLDELGVIIVIKCRALGKKQINAGDHLDLLAMKMMSHHHRGDIKSSLQATDDDDGRYKVQVHCFLLSY